MSNEMRKYLDVMQSNPVLVESVEGQEELVESQEASMALDELHDIKDQMIEMIEHFGSIVQSIGSDFTYNRFMAYPGGHIKAALGAGGYGSHDTTLEHIISELEEEIYSREDEGDPDAFGDDE